MGTPAPLAGVSELGDWLGEAIVDNTPEAKRAEMSLRIASALVRTESGRTWLTDTGQLQEPVSEEAVMVTVYCAARVFENPNAQTRGGIDDYSESWKVDESGAYLTASEKRLLAPLKTGSFSGLGVIATTRITPPSPGAGFVPTDTPDVFFPWS